MKRYIYVAIPALKWIANYLAMFAIFMYLIPVAINRWVEMGIGWAVSGLIAAPFAYWAFKSRVPSDRQLGIFIGFWVLTTLFMESIVDFLTLPDFLSFVLRYEFAVQTLVEIMAVLFMHRVMKRQQAYHKTAEGIEY